MIMITGSGDHPSAGMADHNHRNGQMGKLKLTLNVDKTQICKAPEGESDPGPMLSGYCV